MTTAGRPAATTPTPPWLANAMTANSVTSTLSGDQRNAYNTILDMLTQYGLQTLAPQILGYVQDGLDTNSISYQLQHSKEWQARFSANADREKAGLKVLSPSEYIATEQAYRQIMSTAGLPKGFYDQNSDFTKWIATDVSPTEIQQRVQSASDLVNNADQATRDYFSQYYSKGDMIAYALDQSRAAPLVGKQFEAAKIGGAAAGQGLNVSQGTAEQLASAGLTGNQAKSAFGQIAQEKNTTDLLSSVYGEQALTADELAQSNILGDAATTDRRNKLASQERGSFSGATGIGQSSLSHNNGGV